MHKSIQYIKNLSVSSDTDIDPYPFSQGNKNTLGVINYADIFPYAHRVTPQETLVRKMMVQEREEDRKTGVE